jgi:hypothetical protein
MIRRFVYDAASDQVVEVGEIRSSTSAADRYEEAADRKRRLSDDARAGRHLREASIERADRREFALKKYGTESRWTE